MTIFWTMPYGAYNKPVQVLGSVFKGKGVPIGGTGMGWLAREQPSSTTL